MIYQGIIVSNGGNVRTNNEDNAFLNGYYRKNDEQFNWSYECKIEESFVASVFDGMGGEKNGEVASRLAAEQMSSMDYVDFSNKVEEYVKNANCAITLYAKGKNMGTTYAAVSVEDDNYIFSNIGDSRGYLFRNGNLLQMTKDHNMVQELLKRGILTEEQAAKHPDRNTLYQYLGMEENGEEIALEPYISKSIEVCGGDICLLCSDGLTNMVKDEKIEKILSLNITFQEKANSLIYHSIEAGGKDNVTVVMIEACKNIEI